MEDIKNALIKVFDNYKDLNKCKEIIKNYVQSSNFTKTKSESDSNGKFFTHSITKTIRMLYEETSIV